MARPRCDPRERGRSWSGPGMTGRVGRAAEIFPLPALGMPRPSHSSPRRARQRHRVALPPPSWQTALCMRSLHYALRLPCRSTCRPETLSLLRFLLFARWLTFIRVPSVTSDAFPMGRASAPLYRLQASLLPQLIPLTSTRFPLLSRQWRYHSARGAALFWTCCRRTSPGATPPRIRTGSAPLLTTRRRPTLVWFALTPTTSK